MTRAARAKGGRTERRAHARMTCRAEKTNGQVCFARAATSEDPPSGGGAWRGAAFDKCPARTTKSERRKGEDADLMGQAIPLIAECAAKNKGCATWPRNIESDLAGGPQCK